MAITVSGILTGPDGSPLPFLNIIIKAVQSVPGVSAIPNQAMFIEQSSATGAYSFTLKEGVYAISLSGGELSQSVSLGQAVVNSSSLATDLITLIGASVVPTSTIQAAIVVASQQAATTVAVGTTTTGAPGTAAAVTNGGTATALQLDFVVPQGLTGIATTVADGTYQAATATVFGGQITALAGNASLPPSGSASGALAGTYPGPTLADTTVTAASYTYASFTVNAAGQLTAASSNTPVTSFNTRTGAVTLSSGDVTTALGYTPVNNALGYTWGALQTFSAGMAGAGPLSWGTSGTNGYLEYTTYVQNTNTLYALGFYSSINSVFYGITEALPPPAGWASLGGYYKGMGVGGTTSGTGTPIFGVLNSTQSGNGIGHTGFTVLDNNIVYTFRNTLDDGNGNLTAGNSLRVGASTTLTGTTAGSVVWSQYLQGAFKSFAAQALGYENDTTTAQVITFPVAFVNVPVVTANTTGLTVTVTTTAMTIAAPNATTTYTGLIEVKGF